MSKFDRGVFIFIGLGIWALAMTQIFQPSPAVAIGGDCGGYLDPCHVEVTNTVSVTGLVQTY